MPMAPEVQGACYSVCQASLRRGSSSKLVTKEEDVARRTDERGSRGRGPANGLDPLLGRDWSPASCLGRDVRDARLCRRAFNFL